MNIKSFIIRLITVLALAATTVSCQKEQNPAENENVIVLETGIDEIKTHLSGLKVLWDATDKIVVNNNVSTSTTVLSGGAAARFTIPATTAPLYIFYPASAFVPNSVDPASSKYGTIDFPAVQNYVQGSIAPEANILMATSSSTTDPVKFIHGVSYLKLTVTSSHTHAMKYIEVASYVGGDTSGQMSYNPSTGALSGETSSGKTTRLYKETGLPYGEALYIAIPAKTYSKGLRIRIVDVKNHYHDYIDSDLSKFVATAGTVFTTSINFVPTGTLVDTDISKLNCKITPYYELNAQEHSPSSHANKTVRSTLTPIGGTYQCLDKNITKVDMPVFPSFIQSGNGYMMFYHRGWLGSDGSEQWSGAACHWASTDDGVNWKYRGEIFPIRNGVTGHYDNTIRILYSGPYAARLANGDILVAAAYRGDTDTRHKLLDNGIAVKISSDEGNSWSEETLINVGMCWEPHVLVLDNDSNHPGRIYIYYTDSCPYIEGVWSKAVISTGVSYVYSDDNGLTWKPDDPLNNHLYAFRKLRGKKSSTKVYTDQMPAVIQLCGRSQLVGCGESNYSLTSTGEGSDYWTDVAYSDADGNWGSPDANGEMPAIRTDKLWSGAGSSLTQFPSGETFISYNNDAGGSNKYYYRKGDQDALNWGTQTLMFDRTTPSYASYGFWGRAQACSNHIMIAGVGGNGGSDGVGYPMQVGLFFLNHNIAASNHTVMVDGDNSDWYKEDEALFVGSKGNMHGTVRFSVVGTNLYILAEIENSSLTANDYFRIYFANPSSSTFSTGSKFIQIKPNGGFSQMNLSGGTWSAASLGATNKMYFGGDFYFAEISVPLASLPVSDKSLLINLSAGDAVDGNQAMHPSSAGVSTTAWPKLTY